MLEIPVFGFEPPPFSINYLSNRQECGAVGTVFARSTQCHDVRGTIVNYDILLSCLPDSSPIAIVFRLLRTDDACRSFIYPTSSLVTPPETHWSPPFGLLHLLFLSFTSWCAPCIATLPHYQISHFSKKTLHSRMLSIPERGPAKGGLGPVPLRCLPCWTDLLHGRE